ncbi:MAG TPA: DciA family protein [Rhizomicrobium sp.]|jgi:hypothetical protein|nr:DciA family protein [Rhizomicrobium sp.]
MAQSAKDKQPDAPPARRNRAEPVAREAAGMAAAAFARAGFGDPALVLRWDEIAGPEVAQLARPLRLSEGASGGVLTLKAEPGAALFLQHETRALCDRINAWLGRPAIARLRFVQGPLLSRAPRPPARVAAAHAPPTDPARGFDGQDTLRSALLGLADARASVKNLQD